MSGCLFCNIVDRTIQSTIVYEDEQALAFQDIRPQAPVHILVIPKRHVQSVQDVKGNDTSLMGHLLMVCVKLAKEKGISESGYRIVTNSGVHAGQTVLHLHFHLLGGRSMTWPPG
jgi:histidine triad (HIT) family protein